jgi:hypothetical protein
MKRILGALIIVPGTIIMAALVLLIAIAVVIADRIHAVLDTILDRAD